MVTPMSVSMMRKSMPNACPWIFMVAMMEVVTVKIANTILKVLTATNVWPNTIVPKENTGMKLMFVLVGYLFANFFESYEKVNEFCFI